jgi:hypothetical protein
MHRGSCLCGTVRYEIRGEIGVGYWFEVHDALPSTLRARHLPVRTAFQATDGPCLKA